MPIKDLPQKNSDATSDDNVIVTPKASNATITKIKEVNIQSSMYIPVEGISNEDVIAPIYKPIDGVSDDVSYVLTKTDNGGEWVMIKSEAPTNNPITINFNPVDDVINQTSTFIYNDDASKLVTDSIVNKIPKSEPSSNVTIITNENIVEDSDKYILDQINDSVINRKIDNLDSIITRLDEIAKKGITKYSYDYLSYLFFEDDINRDVSWFYNAVDWIILTKDYEREEDYNENYREEDELDDDVISLIFDKIWNVTKIMNNTAIKNIIGFHIYFNRKTVFLPMIIRGYSISELISKINANFILDVVKNCLAGSNVHFNLFERIWNSYVYSVKEKGNSAEMIMSLKEYYGAEINKDIAEVYRGFTNRDDELILMCEVDYESWGNTRKFGSSSLAFKRFKELSLEYISSHDGLKKFLLDLIPNSESQYMKRSLLNQYEDFNSDEQQLILLMQSFDGLFRINQMWINKNEMNGLFNEFAKSVKFPTQYINGGSYANLWAAWVKYINELAQSISIRLVDADGVNHQYVSMFNDLVKMVNAKFILNYLIYNREFMSVEYNEDGVYTDGTDYVDDAISKMYASIASLKSQMKDIIKYITTHDRRFYADHM